MSPLTRQSTQGLFAFNGDFNRDELLVSELYPSLLSVSSLSLPSYLLSSSSLHWGLPLFHAHRLLPPRHLYLYSSLSPSRLRLARMNEEMREAEPPLGQPGQYHSSSPTEQQYRKCIQEFICLTIEEC